MSTLDDLAAYFSAPATQVFRRTHKASDSLRPQVEDDYCGEQIRQLVAIAQREREELSASAAELREAYLSIEHQNTVIAALEKAAEVEPGSTRARLELAESNVAELAQQSAGRRKELERLEGLVEAVRAPVAVVCAKVVAAEGGQLLRAIEQLQRFLEHTQSGRSVEHVRDGQ